jgi:hypothetical protein
MRVCPSGHRVRSGTPCSACSRAREASRPSRQARGYGAMHDAARRDIERMLPTSCLYARTDLACPGVVTQDDWVAAHVVDGHPEYGWGAAHRACNERAKGDGGLRGTGTGARAVPAASAPREILA